MRKIEAVFFDLDGVLVDACEWHYESLNLALQEEGYRPISRGEHLSTYNGLPTRVKLDMLGIIGERAKRIETRKQAHTMEVIARTAVPMREKLELHEHMRTLGIRTACVTNSIRMTAEEMLRRTGQLHALEFVIANEDVARNKPHPDPYLLAMERMGLPPEKCVCVEDSPKGVQSALQSRGMLWHVRHTGDVNLEGWREYVAGRGSDDHSG
jgi:beta-phosphoglucomutase